MRNKQGQLITTEINWKDITPGGTVYESGSAENFITGDWRTMKPVFNTELCKQCLLCAPTCPDSAIPVTNGQRLDFNFDHCKGCGICAKVCPFGAINLIKDQK